MCPPASSKSPTDLLIQNKVDRVSADKLVNPERFIQGLNPLATIQRVTHSAVDVQALLAMGGGFAEDDPTAAHAGHDHGHHDHEHDHDHDHDHDHHDHDDHQHDESIRPVVVQVDGDVDVALSTSGSASWPDRRTHRCFA